MMNKPYTSIVLIYTFLIAILTCKAGDVNVIQEQESLSGKGKFVYTGYPPLADKPVNVWYYIPENKRKAEIVILMHGNSRNAPGYRDNMLEYAKRHQFILIVPEFSKEQYPKSRDYHQGGVFKQDGNTVAEKNRTFSIIEPLFDHIREQTGNINKNYTLYGFSAGSQFVHRFMMFTPDNRASRIVSASAGYYTIPDYNVDYPYGLKKTNIPKGNFKKFLKRDFTLMVGAADTLLSRKDLPKSSAAKKEGRDRVERAMSFYTRAKTIAHRDGIPFNWKFELVPGVAHSNGEMAGSVADYLFGKEKQTGGLIVQGGGKLSVPLQEELLRDEFLALTPVKDPKLLIIPYAKAGPENIEKSAQQYLEIFRRLGYKDLSVLDLDNPEQALRDIEESDMIWMPGGSQTLLKMKLERAGLVDAIRKRHKAGIPIGGTSAGAGIMSEVMISSAKKMSNTDMLLPVMWHGLGLWPEVIVDQHFSERKRMQRLEIGTRNHPRLIGIGIDENTAAVVQGDKFRVVGANTITVFRVSNPDALDKKLEKIVLKAGDVYQFAE